MLSCTRTLSIMFSCMHRFTHLYILLCAMRFLCRFLCDVTLLPSLSLLYHYTAPVNAIPRQGQSMYKWLSVIFHVIQKAYAAHSVRLYLGSCMLTMPMCCSFGTVHGRWYWLCFVHNGIYKWVFAMLAPCQRMSSSLHMRCICCASVWVFLIVTVRRSWCNDVM